MPLNPSLQGREYPATDPIEITADAIREFADAIGDPNPVYRDESAAKQAGYQNVIAPPTFLTKLNFVYGPQIVLDPELGLNYMLVVHGDQEYVYTRPVRAGDTLVARPKIGSITVRGRNEFLVTEAVVETTGGEQVAVARSTIVSRGTAPDQETQS